MPEIVGRITRIASTAVRLAQEENRRKGIPNVYCLNGKIVWQLPDGAVTMENPYKQAGNKSDQNPVKNWTFPNFHIMNCAEIRNGGFLRNS